jgi:hypothetical protein
VKRRSRRIVCSSARLLVCSSARLLRQFVIEALDLVFAGSFLTVWAAYLGISLLIKLTQSLSSKPFAARFGPNARNFI